MKDQFIELFNEKVKREGASELLVWLKSSDFFTAPASSKHHLAEAGGLVKHSVNVYYRMRETYINEIGRGSDNEVTLTPEEEETIAICALLHDVCKVDCYKMDTKNQKTYDPEKVMAAQNYQIKHDNKGNFIWESVPFYKFEEDFVYGHGEKSVYIISAFIRLSRNEATAIRFHMGAFQDGEKSDASNAFKRYPLALMLHIADMQATFIDESNL